MKPIIADRICQDDGFDKKYDIIGNSVDGMNVLAPMKAQPNLLHHTFLVTKKGELHSVFASKDALPSSFLEDTKWKGRKDMRALVILTDCPFNLKWIFPMEC